MIRRSRSVSLACLVAGASGVGWGFGSSLPQRQALVVIQVVDGKDEPVEDADVRLIRCRGERRFTMVPSFELANPTGVPVQPDRDNCDVRDALTADDGTASFPFVPVGNTYLEAARDSTYTYLLRATKPGYTRVRRLVTPHVARNDIKLRIYRTAGERMFELIDEAQAAADAGELAEAEAAMIQAVAMMTAEASVRGGETPDLLLESMSYLAYVQLSAGNDIAALQTLDELLQLAPDDPFALRTSGVIAVRNRDWEQARARFEAYVLLHPESGDSHLMMGNLLLETGEVDAAIEHLERSVELDFEEPITYRSLGTAYEQAGRLAEAIASFGRYLELAEAPADAEQIRATIAMLRRSPRSRR